MKNLTIPSGKLALAAASYGQLLALTDSDIFFSMRAAEADLSRKLGVALEPVDIFTAQPSQVEIDALNGGRYLVEPGYDLPPGFFAPGMSGSFQLRQRPVLSIESIKLVYPNQAGASFSIPNEWIRLDHKYGHVHLFPSAMSVSAPLSLMTMQAMGAGHTIPNMIRVRYKAGLDNSSDLYPDIVDLIQRMAILRMIHDAFIPDSGSISADGLSENISMDLSKKQDVIDAMIESLKQSLLGPVWGVL